MWRHFLSLTLSVVAVAFPAFAENVQAQSTAGSETPQTGVFLSKLHDPVYPPSARQAAIHGDVELMLRIRQDGTVESVELVSGHSMLKHAAMESAKQSQFECRGCTDAGTTSYPLVYSFQFSNEDCCTASSGPPKVSQSQNRISVTTSPFCLCDPATKVTRKVRSVKCLYLWKCAVR